MVRQTGFFRFGLATNLGEAELYTQTSFKNLKMTLFRILVVEMLS